MLRGDADTLVCIDGWLPAGDALRAQERNARKNKEQFQRLPSYTG